MAKRRYIKDSKGATVSVTTDTLGLEKPLLNENYDIDVHNRNMDKIDEDLKPIDDSYIIELFQHDGDTSTPRDYYTKSESDEKFTTKEETNNVLNKVNEALQVGSNVKQQLVDKLTSEGLDVSTNNTFEELIGSIALGKKYASGTYNTVNNNGKKYNYLTGTTFPHSTYAQIPYFDFEPSLIILHATYDYYSYISVYMCNSIISTENKVIMASFDRGQSNQYNISVKLDNCIDTGSLYEIPTRHSENVKSGYWIAIE